MSNDLSQKNAEYFSKITLDAAIVGETYEIVTCEVQNDATTRLAEMGLVPKTRVTVLKTAPLGDPMEILARGYSVCIRASEAKAFVVRPIGRNTSQKE